MLIDIPEATLRKAIEALREVAEDHAGRSQMPDLREAKDFPEWRHAKVLAAALHKAKQK